MLPKLRRIVRDQFNGIRDTAASHFSVELSATERPQSLPYRPGDFFIRHMDHDHAEEIGDKYCSSSSSTPIEGGALKFGGLEAKPAVRLPPVQGSASSVVGTAAGRAVGGRAI